MTNGEDEVMVLMLPVREMKMSVPDTTLSMAASADGVTNGDGHTSTRITQIENATVTTSTHIAVSAHQRALPANHDISCTHDVVVERVITTVHAVELELHRAVIHVGGGEE